MSNPTKEKNLYAERDPYKLEPYFARHMAALTDEDLRSKSAIAAELAHRDSRIEELKRLLKYAAVYSSFATLFPETFQVDSMKALCDE